MTGGAVVLFTGFPGFIGERLLPRLLERAPEARFVCLVQERFREAARTAVAAIGERHPGAAGRLELMAGDITHPGLGLGDADRAALLPGLTGCFHLAAAYDLALAREVGQKVNVGGTRHVLELLAQAPRFERLHYVSTAYVSGTATGTFRETDLDVGQRFKNHYEETKFLAEVAVAESGLPATIYRPGIVVGDSRTGETAKFDGPYFLMAAMERSFGVFPRVGSGRSPVYVVPVDYVIEGMAALSTAREAQGRTYHLTDPRPSSAQEIAVAVARALGRSFVYLPTPAAVLRAAFAPAAVQRFFGMPVQALDYFDNPCLYDSSQAQAALEPRGIVCPRFPEYVDALVRFYRERKDTVRRTAMV